MRHFPGRELETYRLATFRRLSLALHKLALCGHPPSEAELRYIVLSTAHRTGVVGPRWLAKYERPAAGEWVKPHEAERVPRCSLG